MKKYIIGFVSVCLLVLSTGAFAQSNCTTNAAGDVTCPDAKNSKVIYTTPSAATLKAEATAQAAIDAQTALTKQQQALDQQALQVVIANQIANDSKLSAQQAAITKSLNALRAQTK